MEIGESKGEADRAEVVVRELAGDVQFQEGGIFRASRPLQAG
jgi:hypothetical protein